MMIVVMMTKIEEHDEGYEHRQMVNTTSYPCS